MKNYKELVEDWTKSSKKLMKDTPDELKGFMALHESTMKEGVLDVKTKELIAVSAAVSGQCEWCIAIHVKKALDVGATRKEILEAAWVSVMMGGGPKLMYLQGVLKALEDFS